ncbi:hypothetical protein JGU66_12615 [Myxococcaceae bacterium JPH2]|nr:hypothetical protein [Myxococcaceae bacterium JPH2]
MERVASGGVERVALRRDSRGWCVEVVVGGAARRYRYTSEPQARYFAAVFAMGPRVLPEQARRGRPRGGRVGCSQRG